jgi:predicted RNA binding protein YcfA (HicA-like mRNA interferase family)
VKKHFSGFFVAITVSLRSAFSLFVFFRFETRCRSRKGTFGVKTTVSSLSARNSILPARAHQEKKRERRSRYRLGKLGVLSGADVCRVLKQNGFKAVRRRGSHQIMQERSEITTITVPVPLYDTLRRDPRQHRSAVGTPACDTKVEICQQTSGDYVEF